LINCYCGNHAIYIYGKDIEIYSSFEAPYQDELKQHYASVAHGLTNIINAKDNVTVFNNSRCIDDLVGLSSPLDFWYQDAIRAIKTLENKFHGIVLYKKISQQQLDKILSAAQQSLCNANLKILAEKKFYEDLKNSFMSKIKKLKKQFFGDENDS